MQTKVMDPAERRRRLRKVYDKLLELANQEKLLPSTHLAISLSQWIE